MGEFPEQREMGKLDQGNSTAPDITASVAPEQNEAILRVQADGFYGEEGGFHDVEERWRQRKQSN